MTEKETFEYIDSLQALGPTVKEVLSQWSARRLQRVDTGPDGIFRRLSQTTGSGFRSTAG